MQISVCLLGLVASVNGFAPAHSTLRSVPLSTLRLGPHPACAAPAEANAVDLIGDGGVIKSILEPGQGARPPRGAVVEVHYEGRLAETGDIFDSSRARGKTFRFTLGEGKVCSNRSRASCIPSNNKCRPALMQEARLMRCARPSCAGHRWLGGWRLVDAGRRTQ